MKSNLTSLTKKRKYSVSLFMEVVTYRVPLPVTKIIAYANDTYPICPRCSLSLEREYMSFCDRCGQKINWDLFNHAKIIYPGYKEE